MLEGSENILNSEPLALADHEPHMHDVNEKELRRREKMASWETAVTPKK